MALTLASKDPTEVIRYTWLPDVADGDGIASFTLSASGVTIVSSAEADEGIEFYVSGGTAGATATITATAVTSDGETLEETLYLPVRDSTNAFAYTARDFCNFALRKVSGIDDDPTAAEAEDALERLNDLLAAWAGQGADVGAAFPLTLASVIRLNDGHAWAVKNNLILALADLYPGYEPSPFVINAAQRGLQQVKAALLSDYRGKDVYF